MPTFIYPTSAEYVPSKTGWRLLMLIHGYFKRTGKPWAYLDQAWMIEKLKDWHGIECARSTLNYNLRRLEDAGYLERTQRHCTDPRTGVFVPRVTMFKITKKLRSLFYKVAQYFKRIRWTPTVAALKAGYLAVVGAATNREDAHREYIRLRRRGAN